MRKPHVDTAQPVTEQTLMAALGDDVVTLNDICIKLGRGFVQRTSKSWTVYELAAYTEVQRGLRRLQNRGLVEFVQEKRAGWRRTPAGTQRQEV